MAVKIKVPSNSLAGAFTQPINGYQFRAFSFFASGGLHALALFALGMIRGYPPATAESKRPIYDELIQPQRNKIVWYDYRKPVPDVVSPVKIGTFPKPRGRELSKDAIIATAPNAKSAEQIIWKPVPKVEIRQDVKAPNIILRAAASIPMPKPPPPEPKKVDRPNIEAPKAEQPNPSPPVPKGDVNRAETDTTHPLEVPKPVKTFVPPPAAKQQAQLEIPVATADVPMPDASITGSSSMRAALPEGVGAPSFSKGAPPPSNAPPGSENTAGNAKADIAIAGLHPSDKLNGPLPEGSRAGQFSKAPIVGEPATGEVGGGLSVPNLSIREDRSKATPPHVTERRRTTLYADRVRTIPMSTLSVPLRPASRTIPRAIDARFTGRYVYTMVVPIENFPPYSGDWIVWFAEREMRPGDTPFVRAPVPLRKFESVEPVLPGARTELRVQIAGIIKKDGKIDTLALMRNLSPGIEQAVLQDLASWEFKPAMRDGAAVDVDVVLEIPYSLPPQIAKGAQP
jgi:outer membrane biosynthesis protein TonB